MELLEDAQYTLDDIFDQINKDFGFSYIKDTEDSGHILLGDAVQLKLGFDTQYRKLNYANIVFPRRIINLVDDRMLSDIYLISIESANQIVDLINLMLGESSNENT